MASLFGKLKEGMDQVVSGAQEKIHEAQLRGQLRTIEREKSDQLLALGTAIHTMHRDGEIRLETVHGQLQSLDDLEQRIAEKQQEIQDAVAASAAAAGSGAASAGSSTASSAGAGTERHCECGTLLSPAAKFCPECGRANPAEAI